MILKTVLIKDPVDHKIYNKSSNSNKNLSKNIMNSIPSPNNLNGIVYNYKINNKPIIKYLALNLKIVKVSILKEKILN